MICKAVLRHNAQWIINSTVAHSLSQSRCNVSFFVMARAIFFHDPSCRLRMAASGGNNIAHQGFQKIHERPGEEGKSYEEALTGSAFIGDGIWADAARDVAGACCRLCKPVGGTRRVCCA